MSLTAELKRVTEAQAARFEATGTVEGRAKAELVRAQLGYNFAAQGGDEHRCYVYGSVIHALRRVLQMPVYARGDILLPE
jgi:hypothetical protein